MARGTSIVVSADPKGHFDEGIIQDTSVPGTLMEMVPTTAPAGGRFNYRARSQAAGAVGPICVLREDVFQGKLGVGAITPSVTSGGVTKVGGYGAVGDAYVSGTRCFLYWPIAGEELNLVLGDVAGTGDKVTQGDLFAVNNNGKLIADSSNNDAPFQALETINPITADTVVWMRYLGRQVG